MVGIAAHSSGVVISARGRTALTGCAVAASLFVALAFPGHAAEKLPECGQVTGDPDLAIKVCTRLIEFASLDKPELAKTYHTRGTEWANQGNHDRAIADYTMAIELEPKLADAYYNRALSWSEKGEHDRAIADYDATLQMSPRETRAHVGRAVELTAKGDYKRALADYESVIGIEPKNMSGYFGRGRGRFYSGDYMSAASDFIRAHQLDGSAYTALWLFLARKRAEIPGERTLAAEAGTSGAGAWPAPIVGLYLGSTTPEAVMNAAAGGTAAEQRDRRCEASFYIAQWHLLRNARDAAVPLLREAQKACPSAFMEHEGAVAELRRLQQ